MSLQTGLTALAQAVGADVKGLVALLSGKQATLVSGTNIKTVNGASLLGEGDLVVSGSGGGVTEDRARDIAAVITQYDESPNTTLRHLVCTSRSPVPVYGYAWNIQTFFNGSVSPYTRRVQIAMQDKAYTSDEGGVAVNGALYVRYGDHSWSWTPWQRCDNAELRPGPWIDLRPYLNPAFIYEPTRAGKNNSPAGRVNNGFIELRGIVNYDALGEVPPATGVMLTLPPELRPAMTTSLVGFVDVASPLYSGYATYIVVGATPYNMPGAQHGELRIINMPGGPTSVTTQSFSLDGLRFAQG